MMDRKTTPQEEQETALKDLLTQYWDCAWELWSFRHMHQDVNRPIAYLHPKMLDTLESFKQKIQNYFPEPVTVKDIQFAARIALDAYREVVGQQYLDGSLEEGDRKRLANTATALFLEEWLTNDPACTMSITAFSQWGFQEAKRKRGYNYDRGKSDTYRRATQFYRTILKRYNAVQAEHRRKPVKDHWPEGNQGNQGNQRIELDYITLAWCDAWVKGGFRFLNRFLSGVFFSPKKEWICKQTGEIVICQNKRENEKLYDELQKYYVFLRDTEALYARRDRLEIAKHYVANCMAAYRLERMIHIDLFSRIAYCRMLGQFTVFPYFNQTVMRMAYWDNSYDYEGCLLTKEDYSFGKHRKGQRSVKRNYSPDSRPVDVLNQQRQVDILHLSRRGFLREQAREYTRRKASNDLLNLLREIFPISQLHGWEKTDFLNAAEFFHDEFPILQTLQEACLPDVYSQDPEIKKQGHRFFNLFIQQYRTFYQPGEEASKIVLGQKGKPGDPASETE